MSEPPRNGPPSVFADPDSLLRDFQALLSDVSVCDESIVVSSSKTLAIPSQILRARSVYFDALLSPRWHSAPTALQKPNTPPEVFQDLLEYLTTGSVTLSLSSTSVPHNILLHALAHETAADELEAVVVRHIRTHLSAQTLPDYLRVLHHFSPAPSLEEALVDFAATQAETLPQLLLVASWRDARALWRLLVNAHAAAPLAPRALSSAARALSGFSTVEQGRLIRAAQLLRRERSEDRSTMLGLLRDAPAVAFAGAVEPAGLFTPEELVDKYRRDALAHVRREPRRPRWRVLCESRHPHESGVLLEESARKVVVRSERGLVCHSLLRFDERCSLGGGCELAFYTRDPALGTHPHIFLVGKRLPRTLVIPASEFWYAFASTDMEDVRRTWGWRFLVEPTPPQIDDVD